MRSRIIRLICLYAAAVVLMALLKIPFVLLNGASYAGVDTADVLRALLAGLPMDLSTAGYLTLLPGLITAASPWLAGRVTDRITVGWYWFAAFAIALCWTLDTGLYGYWGFKLDSTPLFYFISSPASAMASATVWQALGGIAAIALLMTLLALLFKLIIRKTTLQSIYTGRIAATAVLTVATALLIIPIRGGVTVSTMNLSSAYHSDDMRLNHAAVNPVFSLLYSLGHRSDFGSTARYMPDAEAESILAAAEGKLRGDTVQWLAPGAKPDIYIIILESFSAGLMPSLGGEPVAMGLDSIARDGLSFTRCIAPGFRTDRGIPAILSGYPCPPATPVMKHLDVAERLPGVAALLRDAGYVTEYYYGGDINFTNQLAYLKASGFSHITSDKDWPVSQRLSKWGVHDGPLFERVLDASATDGKPRLRVVQTSSSHEPFEVPMTARPDEDKRVTAFRYADSCLTAFIDTLAARPGWSNTLVVITADHYGAWPEESADPCLRHHVPLVWTGGALTHRSIDTAVCSHTDIAPTLAWLTGTDPGPFVWGAPLTLPRSSRTVFYADRDCVAAVDSTWTPRPFMPDAAMPDTFPAAAAWLQLNYNYLQSLRQTTAQ